MVLTRRRAGPRYLLARPEPVPGNAVRLLERGDEGFPAMLAAIGAARRWIALESYMVRSDAVGWAFAGALQERARAGVRVRLLIDAIGSLEIDTRLLEECRRAGVEVREFHPIAPWRRRWKWMARDHRKILVVDGSTGFAGSINVSSFHLPVDQGGQGWYDHTLQIRGPAVLALARLFEQGWRRAARFRGLLRKVPGAKPIGPTGSLFPGPSGHADTAVQVVGHLPLVDRYRVRRAYLRAFSQADTSIRLMHCYFVPDRALRRALRRAAERGIRVELILPGRSDVPVVDRASRHLFTDLLHSGVKIHLWEEGVLHAKTAVVDGRWCAVGSYNLDSLSMAFNLEVCLFAVDERLGADLEAAMDRSLPRCRPIEAGEWRKRGAWDRALDWGAWQLRRWL